MPNGTDNLFPTPSQVAPVALSRAGNAFRELTGRPRANPASRHLPAWAERLLRTRASGFALLLLMVLAAGLLGAGITLRSFEYDETYTHVLLAGELRPDWPREPMTAGELRDRFAGLTTPADITQQLVEHDIHPPFYFWAKSVWRWALGPDPLVSRLMSGLLMLGTFALVWRLAVLAAAPPFIACASATLSYVLIYLGTISRAYALAMTLVMLAVLLLARLLQRAEQVSARPRDWQSIAMAACAGLLLGLAVLSHYLAVLVAGSLLATTALLGLLGPGMRGERRLGLGISVAALAGFLPPFLMVLSLRETQGSADWLLAGFDLGAALLKAGRGQTAALFGGLPVYFSHPWSMLVAMPVVLAALVMAATAALGAVLGRAWQHPVRLLVLAAAIATPVGLFALGVATQRSPFEFRYFVFSAPFVAVVFAIGIGELARRGLLRLAGLAAGYVLACQAAGALPLPFALETQQEYRHLVRVAEPHWQPGTLLLVPTGEDGVGMNGPWTWEAPRHWLMRVVRTDDEPRALAAQMRQAPVLLVVTLADNAGRTALSRLRAAMVLDQERWRLVSGTKGLEIWTQAPDPSHVVAGN